LIIKLLVADRYGLRWFYLDFLNTVKIVFLLIFINKSF
jgi:hypothetical protein